MEKDWLDEGFGFLLSRGIIGIVLGIVVLIWPGKTIVVLAVLWGIFAIVEGIMELVAGFSKGAKGRAWLIFMGVIGILAGIVALFAPVLAASAIVWVLGIWLIVRGVFELVGAFSSTRQSPRWLLILTGLLSLALGLLFVFNPGTSLAVVAIWLGIMAIAWGIVFVVLAFMVRGRADEIRAAVQSPDAAV